MPSRPDRSCAPAVALGYLLQCPAAPFHPGRADDRRGIRDRRNGEAGRQTIPGTELIQAATSVPSRRGSPICQPRFPTSNRSAKGGRLLAHPPIPGYRRIDTLRHHARPRAQLSRCAARRHFEVNGARRRFVAGRRNGSTWSAGSGGQSHLERSCAAVQSCVVRSRLLMQLGITTAGRSCSGSPGLVRASARIGTPRRTDRCPSLP